jgi:hypothetical protein
MAGAAAVAIAVTVAAGPVVVPGNDLPESVVALGALHDATALALSGDRATAAAAFSPSEAGGRSTLRIARDTTVRQLDLAGAASALAVADDGTTAFAIVHELDKKGRPRRTSVVRVDLATARTTASVALPMSARGLALGAGGTHLLVAARDEIRTFVLPDMTSGPLYRVIGENVAVAPLAASSRALVAQGNDVVLVDLASAQDRDGLKILERAHAATALRGVVSAPDEPVAMALADGGAAFDVTVDPLQLRARASAVAAAWPGVASAPPTPSPVAIAATQMPPAPPPPPETTTPPPSTVAPTDDGTGVPPQAELETAALPPPVAPPPTAAPPIAPPATDVVYPSGTISGTISGPARQLVAAVVALGPDNVLTQAARVAPDGTGRFAFLGLAPGSYRIMATGVEGRVLACQPPFVTVRLEPGRSVDLPALEVLKGY